MVCLHAEENRERALSWSSASFQDSGPAAFLEHYIHIRFQGDEIFFQVFRIMYWISLNAPLKFLTAGNWKPRYFQAQVTPDSLSCGQPLSAAFRAYHEGHQGFRGAPSLGSALEADLADYPLDDTWGQLAGHAGQTHTP